VGKWFNRLSDDGNYVEVRCILCGKRAVLHFFLPSAIVELLEKEGWKGVGTRKPLCPECAKGGLTRQ
jgi:hypothetical protein